MCQCGEAKIIFKMCGGKIFKTLHWLECRQTGQVGVELQRNCQPSFCRQKVSLEVKRLVVLVSARWLHGCLLGLLITVRGLAQWRIYSTTVDTKHQSSNLAKSFMRSTSPAITPNPCYRLPFFRPLFVCRVSLVRWLGSSFAFFCWACAVAKMQMCYPMAWTLFVFVRLCN